MSPIITEYEVIDPSMLTLSKGGGCCTAGSESLETLDYDIHEEIGGVSIIGRNINKNVLSEYKNKKEKSNKVGQGHVVIGSVEKDRFSLLQISTPLAIFTTAYARILMSEYKIKYQDNLYYSDTDSLVLDCELPSDKVGKELGKFKLEYKVQEGVFISPKVYALLLEDSSEIIKVKGLKDANKKVSFNDLKSLTHDHEYQNQILDTNIKLNNDRWVRNIAGKDIQILKSCYTLSFNENKRLWVTDQEGNLINTKPFNIDTIQQDNTPCLCLSSVVQA